MAVSAGLVLFFFNETGDRITRLEAGHEARFIRLEENQQQIAVTLATLVGEFAAFREDVDTRFDAIDARFDAIDNRFAGVDTRFDAIDNRFAGVDTRFAVNDARFDAVDNRFDAIETRLTRLEESQQEIAVTLARLVALFEAHFEVEPAP